MLAYEFHLNLGAFLFSVPRGKVMVDLLGSWNNKMAIAMMATANR